MHVLYTLVIYPIVQIIDIVFVCCTRIFHSTTVSIIGSSLAVTLLTLPLYFAAEKLQQKERDVQKRLAPKAAKIKQVFAGDEQYMILSTYYRQNHYHPVYALRNTFGLLIQIPFFIAAYSYLSHLDELKGASFLFIRDFSKPDALLSIRGGGGGNLLPFLMTSINVISGAVYTRGLLLKDKLQVYGIAAVFLVLLYNSPSGLVLYWTCNNIFSLTKNILHKTKKAKQVLYGILVIFILYTWYYFLQKGLSPKRICVLLLFTLLLLIPLIQKAFCFVKTRLLKRVNAGLAAVSDNKPFVLSALILFLLAGLTNPSLLISSSVEEFSFIERYTSPFPFIVNVCFQAAGLFLFWLISLFFI
ncbi:MAG: YidC/Oxa1 family membrane protein insertase, partial [Spirochaetaceae bacterium]|nr:YidC/Oxa1 family membrane protein insertase [Spirochaetaceae bacterium]